MFGKQAVVEGEIFSMQQFKARADERHVDLVMEKLTKDIRGWAYEFVDVRGRRGLGMNMVDKREQTSSNTRETPKSSGFQRSGPFLLRGQLGWDCEIKCKLPQRLKLRLTKNVTASTPIIVVADLRYRVQSG